MYHATKKKVHSLLHPEIVGDSNWDKIINIFIVILIVLNVTAVMLETVDTIERPMRKFFHDFDFVSVIIFTIEYILRVWSSNHDPRYKHSVYGRLRYMVSPAALIDLMAILPFYVNITVGLFYKHVSNGSNFRLLRILRLLRFFRLFRLTAYTKSTKLVTNVFKSRFHDLMLSFIVTSLMIVISSCLVYYAENNAQPEKFSSIPATMWWAVETLTTVGFGDMYPVTVIGKLFTVVIIMMGVALLALPAGIITTGFIEESKKMKKPHSIKCPHCGKEFEPGEHHEEH